MDSASTTLLGPGPARVTRRPEIDDDLFDGDRDSVRLGDHDDAWKALKQQEAISPNKGDTDSPFSHETFVASAPDWGVFIHPDRLSPPPDERKRLSSLVAQ
ncbi:hypothetical protein HGRIS_005336 [Hohenbuehelia grisea]|uniref:Uncharacterized protein n=1 Tax=Hohenbuehelia grisea TaxID=104357 RepID=A0ABR3JFM1_9AGAR